MEPSLDQSDSQPSLSWSAFSDPDKCLDDLLLSDIYQHSRGQRASAAQITDPNNNERLGCAAQPHAQDYPLWCIGCRVGLEEDAVFSLLQRAGWVYVEGLMNNGLTHLLKLTPGIIHTRNGPVWQTIDMSDWTKMLMMHDPTTVVSVGRWVRVGKGVFKGDIGLVVRCEDWGSRGFTGPSPQSANNRPFAEMKCLHNVDPKRQGNGVYTAGGLTFEHGLIQKKYDLHSLASNVPDIPSHLFSLFQCSRHPAILASAFPHPQEWSFEEGEAVIIHPSGKKGTIIAINTECLEVDLSTGEGAVAVPWYYIRKVIAISDFVHIMAGPLHGTTGWVDGLDEDTVHLVEKHIEGNISVIPNSYQLVETRQHPILPRAMFVEPAQQPPQAKPSALDRHSCQNF
ncbi:hypothetical protein BYT27DRAFT_7232217 [Phlegmacium glaucopus]|nr:hypothetical protein BYT27DRAFT_7232217 [Phlegmacium glaucopus]